MGSTKTKDGKKKVQRKVLEEEVKSSWLSSHPWTGIFILIFFYIIFLYAPTLLYQLFATSPTLRLYHIIDFFGVAFYFLLIVPLIFGLPTNRSYKDNCESSRVFNFKPIYRTIIFGIFSAILLTSCMLLASYLAVVIGQDGSMLFDPSLLVNPLTVNIYTSLKPGIWEEVAFRGIILVLLLKKYSKKTAIIVNGLLFGLFHAVNLLFMLLNAIFFGVEPDLVAIYGTLFQIVYTMFFGFFLAYLFIKANSLIPCIIAHYLVDALSTLVAPDSNVNLWLFWVFATVIGFGVLPAILNILIVRTSCYAWPQKYDEQVKLFDTFLARKKIRSR
ncbi:MAG: CPBP family intramembrane metalloprotease [Candidatus Heimdallarchaeota archaeon]|nr:CPBP family intramembrane metalloprotease [Candidatus Heimdallarchaeota archaeon]